MPTTQKAGILPKINRVTQSIDLAQRPMLPAISPKEGSSSAFCFEKLAMAQIAQSIDVNASGCFRSTKKLRDLNPDVTASMDRFAEVN